MIISLANFIYVKIVRIDFYVPLDWSKNIPCKTNLIQPYILQPYN